MDENARAAETEFKLNFSSWTVHDIAEWWERWYKIAGHKRLGRVLVAMAKHNKTE